MSPDDLERERYRLLFSVRRSVRYHTRRRRFFDRFHTCATALQVLLGSATLLLFLKDLSVSPLIPAALVTLLSTLDLVIGSTAAAREHHDLTRRFIALEKQLLAAGEYGETELRVFKGQRLDIEADEPPPLHVLNAICHNETLRALGHSREELVRIGPFQRGLAHFFDWRESSIGL